MHEILPQLQTLSLQLEEFKEQYCHRDRQHLCIAGGRLIIPAALSREGVLAVGV